MSLQIAKHHFTARQYERMGETGILPADKRYELIEGEIIEMSPIGKRHAASVDALNTVLNKQVGDAAIVRVQNPILLEDDSEPLPDIALLKPREDFYREELPRPSDVLLVIEVADTTLEYDRRVKLPTYARAGIPEVVILNLRDEQLEHHTQPVGGAYQLARVFKRGEPFTTSNVPGVTIDLAYVLG